MTTTTTVDTRMVPLEHVLIVEGFNPRALFDEAELERLARSLAETGMLHPLIVYPTDDDDRFELGDGERRYRAAQRAELTEVPVIVRERSEQDGAELVEAIAANLHRQDHTPMEEARAFGRLLEAGLTRKGICERLAVTRERVRERLALLELPEELHAGIDDGSIPLHAVKTLLALAAMHPELPAAAAAKVGQPPRQAWGDPLGWADVIEDPLGAILPRYGDETPELPAGVYDVDWPYPVAVFTLDEKAAMDLEKLLAIAPEWADAEIRLEDGFDQAQALGAGHSSARGRSRIIVGQEVCDQIAGEAITRALKRTRTEQRAEANVRRQQAEAHGQDGDAAAADPEAARQQEEVRRRAEREEAAERKAQAERFNDELGAAVYKAFASVKATAEALKVLAAVDLTPSELSGLAGRGMRYGFPGWVTTEQTRGGKTKRVYLQGPDVTAKVTEYLQVAEKPGEIVGRCLTVVVMAVLADEECVARSNRSLYSLHAYRDEWGCRTPNGLPWQLDTIRLVEDLALERLPEHLTAAVRKRREQERVAEHERQRAEQAAAADDDELRGRLDDITADERLAAYEAHVELHGRASVRSRELLEHVLELNTQQASTDAEPDDDATDPPDADASGGDVEDDTAAEQVDADQPDANHRDDDEPLAA